MIICILVFRCFCAIRRVCRSFWSFSIVFLCRLCRLDTAVTNELQYLLIQEGRQTGSREKSKSKHAYLKIGHFTKSLTQAILLNRPEYSNNGGKLIWIAQLEQAQATTSYPGLKEAITRILNVFNSQGQ